MPKPIINIADIALEPWPPGASRPEAAAECYEAKMGLIGPACRRPEDWVQHYRCATWQERISFSQPSCKRRDVLRVCQARGAIAQLLGSRVTSQGIF